MTQPDAPSAPPPGNPPRRRGPLLLPLPDDPPSARAPRPMAATGPQGDATGAPAAGPADAPSRATRGGASAEPSPADAPPIDMSDRDLPRPRTMEMVTRIVSARPSRLTRLFLGSALALFSFLLTVAALDFLGRVMLAYPLLGWVALGLFVIFTVAALGVALREWFSWRRLRRIDAIQRRAAQALAQGSLDAAGQVSDEMDRLYARRPELEWQRQRFAERRHEVLDCEGLLVLAEAEFLVPLDQLARREVEAAARTVAATTALVPIALADVAAALVANLRMIRRIAEIYGGRAGSFGGWKLARGVIAHLIATGAVAAGDDLVQTVAGGGILSRLSRRFGEGLVNGALTARVGVAAMEVCRPMPFIAAPRPKVSNLLSRGLRGLFGSDPEPKSSRDRGRDPSRP